MYFCSELVSIINKEFIKELENRNPLGNMMIEDLQEELKNYINFGFSGYTINEKD